MRRCTFVLSCAAVFGCGTRAVPVQNVGETASAPEIPAGSTSTVACAELPQLVSSRTVTRTLSRARHATVFWYSVEGSCRRDAELTLVSMVLQREEPAGTSRWVPSAIDAFFPEVFFLWGEVRPGDFKNLDFAQFEVRGATIAGALILPPEGAPFVIPTRAVRRIALTGKIGSAVPEGRYRFVTGLHRARIEGREHEFRASVAGDILILKPRR